ncbi:hypothetical protein ACJMK2_036982 [Sinanodonta woodiana]|uniref:BPTI/Kunitz inhibitor domain-containing protein n=1 Tax=Sinanodonta woodiana TaxID=1069815 RepID=A0ABD3WIV0_SINWO
MKSFFLILICVSALVSARDAFDVEVRKCALPADPGPCLAYMPMFFYNASSCKCERFIYGGCQGNDNRFKSKSECYSQCGKYNCPKCSLPAEKGPCRAKIPRFYYNAKTCKCELFFYGGCEGNANNYESLEECWSSCGQRECPACRLPSKTGPCKAHEIRYFFNFKTCLCESFVWGGCKGNGNNFGFQKECQRACKSSGCPVCSLPADPGPCKGAFPAYFFNSDTNRCEEFIYGGCQGNANRFISKEDCERKCKSV